MTTEIVWSPNGGTIERPLVVPVLPLPDAKAAKLANLAAIRFQRETGGIVLAHPSFPEGVPIKTDRETQSIVLGAYVKASSDPEFSINYKISDGIFMPVDAEMITLVGDAVFAHVQACFDNEATLTAAILAAADLAALDEIDINEGWPE